MRIQKNKLLVFTLSCIFIFIMQSFTQEKKIEEKGSNLKVFPKDISEEELIKVMKNISKSLGVKCGFCHQPIPGGEKPKFDFASDAKPEKQVARDMMLMTRDINIKYLERIGEGHFEKITCVTCHMGQKRPTVSLDSLPQENKTLINSPVDTLKSVPTPSPGQER